MPLPLELSPEAVVILVLVGAIVVGLLMLWGLGFVFETAVETKNRIGKGFLVLVTVTVILAYGWVVLTLLPIG